MKKLLTISICLLLTLSIAMAVSAADSVQITVTPEKDSALRGEVVTFSVAMPQLENCRSAAIVLNFDKNVLAFVEGSCTVADTALARFSTMGGKVYGTFVMTSPTTLSGQLFIFKMKIKDDAAFGDTTISFTTGVRNSDGSIPSAAEPVTLTVFCDHTGSSFSPVDQDNHIRTCTICQTETPLAHTWDEGTITTEPTCKDKGLTTYTCTICNDTKTEAIAETDNHTWGDWSTAGDADHKRTCSVCQQEEAEAHSFDLTAWVTDADSHWHACSCGAKQDAAAHNFTKEVLDDAHRVPGSAPAQYYYDCAVCDVTGTQTFIRGDVDMDTDVDEDDVIYLLSHLLMPHKFPVHQTVDYDNSGEVTEDDVICLLLYVLLPESFPI